MNARPLPLRFAPASLRYRTVIGTGGIGSGRIFALRGNHTLGREESRAGRYTDSRDYCKLHIVTHYLQVLLGPGTTVLPVGAVGNDEAGVRLLDEMTTVGLDLTYVQHDPDHPTLSCICLVYPDGSGGNITVDNSASAWVTPSRVASSLEALGSHPPAIVLAVPEVPLAARQAMLEGARPGDLRAASFLSEEMPAVRSMGLLSEVDVLAINLDEAATLAEHSVGGEPGRIIAATLDATREINAELTISITGGRGGSWLASGDELYHQPAHEVGIGTTAGAGDAHLSGLLAGLALGLTPRDAHELATLVAAAAVTSVHTINFDLGRQLLGELATGLSLTGPVRELVAEQDATAQDGSDLDRDRCRFKQFQHSSIPESQYPGHSHE